MSKITNQSSLTSKYELPDGSQQEVETKSNISETENMTTSFTKVRTTAKEFGIPKEEIEQTLVLTNTSEFEITDVKIQDTISAGATFVTGTVTVDGTEHTDFDPVTGFDLPNSIAGNNGTVTIKYKLKIDDEPTTDEVTAVSKITYSVKERTDLEENSNTNTIALKKEGLEIAKTSNYSAVIKGETLTFQNVIENKGNVTSTNLVFKDDIPQGTQFVTGSVKVDGTSEATFDPATGFAVKDLQPGGKVTITFDVTVD